MRRFRFGVQISTAPSFDTWIAKARLAEAAGFATFLMPDHLADQLAPVPALASVAAATQSIRIGSFVFNNDLRHPALLAKEVATLDVLSGGRVEFGLGAGWLRDEYAAAGLTFESSLRRLQRMEEALTVLEGLWGDGPTSFAGEHYAIAVLDGRPKPIQRPRPPIMLAGGGPRLLTFAARRADIVGINPQARHDGTLDWSAGTSSAAVAQRVGWIRQAAGDRFESLELNIGVKVSVSRDPRVGARKVARSWNTDARLVMQSPYALVGTRRHMSETLLEIRERHGISYFTVGESGMEALAPIVADLSGT